MSKLHGTVLAPTKEGGYEWTLPVQAMKEVSPATYGAERFYKDADAVEATLYALDREWIGWRKALTDAPNERVRAALRWIKAWRRT